MGGVFSVLAKQSADGYQHAAEPKAMKDDYDKSKTCGNVALGSYIAGGAVAVTGAVLWVYASQMGKVAIVPAGDHNGVSLTLTGGW